MPKEIRETKANEDRMERTEKEARRAIGETREIRETKANEALREFKEWQDRMGL